MAASAKNVEKTAPKTETPKKTPAELQKAWGTAANRTLAALERAAKATERLSRRAKNARPEQVTAFQSALTTLTERIEEAARGRVSAVVGAVPE